MKKILAVLAVLLLLALAGCSPSQSDDSEEPYSADFTIREDSPPTEVLYDASNPVDYNSEDNDTLNFSALRSLLSQSVFGNNRQAVSLWNHEIHYALVGDFNDSISEALEDISHNFAQCSNFLGMRETLPEDAELTIVFGEGEESVSYEADDVGNIVSARITVSSDLPVAKQKAELYQNIFRICGFQSDCNTSLQSILSTTPGDLPQNADWILLDFLYGETQSGMSKAECMSLFETYFTTPH